MRMDHNESYVERHGTMVRTARWLSRFFAKCGSGEPIFAKLSERVRIRASPLLLGLRFLQLLSDFVLFVTHVAQVALEKR